MAEKLYRIEARLTRYAYIEITAGNLNEAVQKAWNIPMEHFKTEARKDEWKVTEAQLLERVDNINQNKTT